MSLGRLVAVVGVILAVLGLSAVSARLWHGPGEAGSSRAPRLALRPDTTVQEIAQQSGLPRPALREALGLRGPEDLPRSLAELGLSPNEAQQRLQKAGVLAGEEGSKDWRKILAEFVLWAAVLTLAFVLLRRRISPALRMGLLAGSVLVFGVALGPSPNPMGTVKDAVMLWGRSHAIFPPRMIALGVFLLMVVLANKLICGWGCQLGALQDLLFRLSRGTVPARPPVKVPFAISNTVRVLCFVALVVAGLVWATDLVEPIDPFRVYSPASLGLLGATFLGALLAASAFVYRPWCHFCCPFGLVGWLAEKVSLAHVRVDYSTCVACQQCARACPSGVMEAILKQDRVVPDCFACGVCLTTCPTRSVHFDAKRRVRVPEGTFAPGKPPHA